MAKFAMRKCDKCGELFVPRSSKQHFCRKQITRNCLVCGEEFITNCSDDMKLTCSKPECKKVSSSLCEPTERVCPTCGVTFTTIKNKQVYCNEEKEAICEVCGNKFTYICNGEYKQRTCSEACANVLITDTRKASAQLKQRVCKWCGKLFTPREHRDVYCYDTHFQTCAVCGKQFEIDVRKDTTVKTCSKECRYILAKQNTNIDSMVENLKHAVLEKYGVDNVAKLPEFTAKAQATSLERYGKEWYTQTDEYKEKLEATCREKYGVPHHLMAKEVIDKRTETVKEKYGVDNVFQNELIKNTIVYTNMNRYGFPNPSQSSEIQDRIKTNNMAKYGVTHPMMLDEFKQKAEKTCIDRYGSRSRSQVHINNIDEWYQFSNDPESFIKHKYDYKPKTAEIAKYFNSSVYQVEYFLRLNDAVTCVQHVSSKMEDEIVDFLHSLNSDLKISRNTRSVISPYEIDIYLPDLKLGIECNPTFTHNSSFGDCWGSSAKPISYHKNKSDMASDAGVFLFHIFGYEWSYKKDIIKGMIQNLIGCCSERVYARLCSVVVVDGKTASEFLAANHRQGAANSSIRLGLMFNGTLVSLMTFGRRRVSIGRNDLNKDDYELVRFCSTLGTTVVGGASKLFSYFVKTYHPDRVASFSDRAHTRGLLYATLGFKPVKTSDPGYVWVDTVTDKATSRISAQKHKLSDLLGDPGLDMSKSEKQIMEDHGYAQVYDAGTVTWEWSNKI